MLRNDQTLERDQLDNFFYRCKVLILAHIWFISLYLTNIFALTRVALIMLQPIFMFLKVIIKSNAMNFGSKPCNCSLRCEWMGYIKGGPHMTNKRSGWLWRHQDFVCLNKILPFCQWSRPRTWRLLFDTDLEAAGEICRSRTRLCIGLCWEIHRWVCLYEWEQGFSCELGSSSTAKGSSQWSSNSLLSTGSKGLSLPKQASPSSQTG